MDSKSFETLAVGDSFGFSGVQWAVRELNLFQDPTGYRTSEWRIESSRRGEYYIMLEQDPAQTGGPNWYLSERLPSPKLLSPEMGKDVYNQLQESFSLNKTPPAALMVNGITFLFESSSSGQANWDGESLRRTTWEYWDKTHSRNLALESWANGELLVYLARKIAPDKIYDLQRGGAKNVVSGFFGKGKPGMLEWICAIIVTLAGIVMFFMGGSQ
jgi:hypothetical protein